MYYLNSIRSYLPSPKQTAIAVTAVGALTGYATLGLATTATVGLGLAITGGLVNGVINALFHAQPLQKPLALQTKREKGELAASFVVSTLSTGYLFTNVYLALEQLEQEFLKFIIPDWIKTGLSLPYQLCYLLPMGVLGPTLARNILRIIKEGSRTERALLFVALLLGTCMMVTAGKSAFLFYDSHPNMSGLNAAYQKIYGLNIYLTCFLHLGILVLAIDGNLTGFKTLGELYRVPGFRDILPMLGVIAMTGVSLLTTLFLVKAGNGFKDALATMWSAGAVGTATVSNAPSTLKVAQAVELAVIGQSPAPALNGTLPIRGFSAIQKPKSAETTPLLGVAIAKEEKKKTNNPEEETSNDS